MVFIEDQPRLSASERNKGNKIASLFVPGNAPHAIQDFYSHSNYAEIMYGADDGP
jgi:hypothetical protein